MFRVYCLSYNNEERRKNMEYRFNTLSLNYFIYEGVSYSDNRIICEKEKRVWSCMYGHLDMIKMFCDDETTQFGIFCEDDILIRSNFNENINNIINDFIVLDLDVLLLGYLVTFKINKNINGFSLKSGSDKLTNNKYSYHNFEDYVWGTQMYMLSKSSAKKLLEKYNNNYALKTINDNTLTPFSADWTITKDGNRALIYPCLAVETGAGHYSDDCPHGKFHKRCHEIQYEENEFI